MRLQVLLQSRLHRLQHLLRARPHRRPRPRLPQPRRVRKHQVLLLGHRPRHHLRHQHRPIPLQLRSRHRRQQRLHLVQTRRPRSRLARPPEPRQRSPQRPPLGLHKHLDLPRLQAPASRLRRPAPLRRRLRFPNVLQQSPPGPQRRRLEEGCSNLQRFRLLHSDQEQRHGILPARANVHFLHRVLGCEVRDQQGQL